VGADNAIVEVPPELETELELAEFPQPIRKVPERNKNSSGISVEYRIGVIG
jgi:hypothetical protein